MAQMATIDAVCDLRRRKRREQVERLLERSSLLPPGERSLVEAVYRDGRSVTELARAASVKGAPRDPRRLSRKLRRAVRRMLSDEFVYVARHREQWPASRRRVATATCLHGLSMREASEQLGMSLHSVRRHHQAVRTLVEADA